MQPQDVPGVNELLREADHLPPGPVALALYEEAVRLADAHGADELAFALRRHGLMWPAVMSGRPEKMLVAFTWCVGKCTQEPSRFDEEELFWPFVSWVAPALRHFPQFPRAQIADIYADMRVRFARQGRGLRRIIEQESVTAAFFGDADRAAAGWEHWQRLPRDPRYSEASYEASCEVFHFLYGADDARAVERAEPILSGRIRSSVVPHQTFPHLLLPLLRLGQTDEAVRCHATGYRLVIGEVHWLGEIARHLEFLALTDNLDHARRGLEKHWPLFFETREVIDQLYFHLAVRYVLERLRAAGLETKLRVPSAHPFASSNERPDLEALIHHADREARKLAAMYDARAGNDHFTQLTLGVSDRLGEWERPLKLPR